MNKLINLIKQVDKEKLDIVATMCSLMLIFVFVASCVGFWELTAFLYGVLGAVIMFTCIHWCIMKLLLKAKELFLHKFN